MYEGLVLIDPDASITPDALAGELRRLYAGDTNAPDEITVAGEELRLRWGEFTLVAGLSAAPHVAEESAWLAEQAGAKHPARNRIALCRARFEISSDPDPDMVHFNDYLFIGEALSRLGRVYRFDQASNGFVE